MSEDKFQNPHSKTYRGTSGKLELTHTTRALEIFLLERTIPRYREVLCLLYA